MTLKDAASLMIGAALIGFWIGVIIAAPPTTLARAAGPAIPFIVWFIADEYRRRTRV